VRPIVVLSLTAATLLLAACETTPPAAATTAQAQPAVQNADADSKRCERREVTGSRLARCDDASVRTIRGDEVRTSGMPSSGPGRGGGQP